MNEALPNGFQERVEQAAEVRLRRNRSIGPLELLQELGWLQPAQVAGWRQGLERYPALEPFIQVGPAKLDKAIRHFQEWVFRKGLRPMEVPHTRRGAAGIETLRVTVDGDPGREKFYGTYYAPADLPEKQAARVAAKLTKPPDLVVFEKVGDEGQCHECGAELAAGSHLLMERGQPLCLACADMDQLVFLPAGDAAMSRRARKHSTLAAVVVRFRRARKRYERQGLLVTPAGLAQAEEECAADAPERAEARARAAVRREADDGEFRAALAATILQHYPGCPPAEAREIAGHTGLRGSGRVGRSAAGQALEAKAVELAVRAHIRHVHTDYDELLMGGTERLAARAQVRAVMDDLAAKWAGA